MVLEERRQTHIVITNVGQQRVISASLVIGQILLRTFFEGYFFRVILYEDDLLAFLPRSIKEYRDRTSKRA